MLQIIVFNLILIIPEEKKKKGDRRTIKIIIKGKIPLPLPLEKYAMGIIIANITNTIVAIIKIILLLLFQDPPHLVEEPLLL